MGGRGRGRGGASKSFSREQLNVLGGSEVIPGPVTQPPPLFPPLERKPVPLMMTSDLEYLVILRQDFIEHMLMSPSFLKMPESKDASTVQTIDKLVAQLPSAKEKFDWKLLPSELRPKVSVHRKKVLKEINIEQRLSQLEKLEEKTDAVDKTVKSEEKEDDPDGDMQMLEDEDEEMDDGTDYANNYFDNGEQYEDEDDNNDDGPIY